MRSAGQAGPDPSQGHARHQQANADNDRGRYHWNEPERRMTGGFAGIGQPAFSVEDHHPDGHEHTREPDTEGHQQDQPCAHMAEGDGGQQQDQGGRTGDKAAARAQSDQAA